ncbi:WD repeat-containing protein 6 [Didymella glomerata]|uniref:WD repeat-containing protein 6 n=1 Tax=Didymella glomerata TaxID=749621 RepID=A0A9W8X572_9PLEO|nr:WD repeat-containing protein 6 [Didymella glomerata]
MSSLDDEDVYNQGICAAVTAHNALLEITIWYQNSTESHSGSLNISVSELTASSRSILYSAHLLWESTNCILVAAGTAFGEIMYWSWTNSDQGEAHSQIHQVFLGHEGSIFDVRISQELQRGCCGNLKRVIASCSDDRTIRLWDVSDVDVNVNGQEGDLGSDAQRTRHTGFSVAAADEKPETSNCLAIGWGHTSRVWRIRFLESSPCDGALSLLSAGEDATSRTWKLVASIGKGDGLPCSLQQTDCSAYHNGKNMWSIAAYRQSTNSIRVASGAADGKIATYPLVGAGQQADDQDISVAEYTLQDLIHMAEPTIAVGGPNSTKASKKGDSIRSYCFISDKTFLLITNTGKILVESFRPPSHSRLNSSLTNSLLVDQLEDLSGYSTCTGNAAHGVAFLAGTKGGIYMYSARDSSLRKIHDVTGKVGALFVTDALSSEGQKQLALLITLVGQKHSQLLFVDVSSDPSQPSSEALSVPASEILTGSTMTNLYTWRNRLLVHGFSSKKWFLYDITAEEEVMGIETGGAHRSWAFQQNPDSETPGGSLVWTRTSSLHICSQVGSNHDVLRSGGHGREIKAVAISPPILTSDGTTQSRTLIATGAEDTAIKISTYDAGELVCKRTLRKHTTGIQHLQWSSNGEYLFSSAGSEEFYIWRVRSLPTLDIGIVCEHIYAPESEFQDLRILSFDAVRHDSNNSYAIALVFSDSSVKVRLPLLTTIAQYGVKLTK